MRVLHIIVDLGLGGAELMLERLLRASRGGVHAHEVVSLTDSREVGRAIEALGFPVHTVGMRLRTPPTPRGLARLARLVRDRRPDVVQTWMYHSDLLGGLAAKLVCHAPVVWGIHHSSLDARTTARSTRLVVAACARLSHVVPTRIVCVSSEARDLHLRVGYAPDKFDVIPNGFDLREYRNDPARRDEIRAELGLDPGQVAIGLVARVVPQKDHGNFARAAAILAERCPEVRFVLCGHDATTSNAQLVATLREAGVLARCTLLGARTDVPRILNGLDVAALSSAFGEAFPLAIGEAMATGIPCVVTDVGDSAFLVGDTGRVVPPRDPDALAGALEALVRMGDAGRRRLGAAARARVKERFEIAAIAAQYVDVYERALQGGRRAQGVAGARAS